jgi:methylmalonyl-CoA mutase
MNPFPPVSKSDWLAKVEADLKGTSPDRLRSTTPGGLDIEPLYTAEAPHAQGAAGFPGVFPYVRGSAPVGGWLIRQEYDDPRPSVCKAQIELDLGRATAAVCSRRKSSTTCSARST